VNHKTNLLIALVLVAAAPRAANEIAVSVFEEPRHRLVYDKGPVKIFNTSIPAGDMSVYHSHGEPTLYVVLNPVRMRNQDRGAEWIELDPAKGPPAGAFLFRNYREQPQTHRVQNVDTKSFQVLGVAHTGSGAAASGKSPTGAPPELENQWFAGYRTRLPAGATTATHRHAFPVFVVQVSPGNSVVIEHGGPGSEKTVPGTWSIHDAGVEHQLANIGAADLELVEIEMK
jgi:hypothetical protein